MYGALHVAATYCGMLRPPESFPGIWQHGCNSPWTPKIPKLHDYSVPDSETRLVFVARKDQEELLTTNGYCGALAIGLPFVYLPEVDVARIPRSLLVVPIHSGEGIPFDENLDAMANYADYIKSIERHFSQVIVIQHKGDLVNGQWSEQFGRVGIECIVGAHNEDANALLRIKMLFSQFDFVTTNGWGSHVAYAMACGAKVSIVGPAPGHSIDAYLKDVGYGKDVSLIEEFLSAQTQEEEKKFLKKMYVSPENGVIDISLGEWFVGVENKKTPLELSTLFGWNGMNQVVRLTRSVAERDGQIASLSHQIYALRNSTAWRITFPLRWIAHQIKRVKHLAYVAPTIFKVGGGIWPTLAKTLHIWRSEGRAGIKRIIIDMTTKERNGS